MKTDERPLSLVLDVLTVATVASLLSLVWVALDAPEALLFVF